MKPDLIQRHKAAYDRCKDLRETKLPDGSYAIEADKMLALIELRNMAPEVEMALEELRREREEWFTPPRLDE